MSSSVLLASPGLWQLHQGPAEKLLGGAGNPTEHTRFQGCVIKRSMRNTGFCLHSSKSCHKYRLLENPFCSPTATVAFRPLQGKWGWGGGGGNLLSDEKQLAHAEFQCY